MKVQSQLKAKIREYNFIKNFENNSKRKQDTRNKIELGGLVIKAGLNEYPKSIILGILIEAINKISEDKKVLDHYQALGDIEFSKSKI